MKLGARAGSIYIEVHPDIYETAFDYPGETQRLLQDLGWTDLVDPSRVAAAIEARSGFPTRISPGENIEAAPGAEVDAGVF